MNELTSALHLERWPTAPDWLFWVAMTLIAGALLGEAAQRFLRLPRIAGYALVGMAAALAMGENAREIHSASRVIVDLALALLLFELGSRVSLRWLRRNPVLLLTSLLESAASFAAVCGVLLLLGFDLHFALACAALLIAASGAVVGRVSTELKSAGQVTDRMIVLTALNTLYAVFALKLVTGWIHLDQHGDWVLGFAQPLYTFAGSLLLAALLSRAVAWVMRRFEINDENTVLLLLGLILLALATARLLSLSTLVVPLLAGVMLRNASERPCIWPRHFGTAGGVLVLMLFVIVGSSWSTAALEAGAFVSLTVLVVRWLAKATVLVSFARLGGIDLRQGLALALTLAPLSATSLVLLADLQSSHPQLAHQMAPIILSAIAVMAVIGPITVQWGLRISREHQRPEVSNHRGRT